VIAITTGKIYASKQFYFATQHHNTKIYYPFPAKTYSRNMCNTHMRSQLHFVCLIEWCSSKQLVCQSNFSSILVANRCVKLDTISQQLLITLTH